MEIQHRIEQLRQQLQKAGYAYYVLGDRDRNCSWFCPFPVHTPNLSTPNI